MDAQAQAKFNEAQQLAKKLIELQNQLKKEGIETTLDKFYGLRIL